MAIDKRESGSWSARIVRKGVSRYLGSFRSKVLARAAYHQAELEDLLHSDNMLTYRLCSPDFMGMRRRDVAFALGIPVGTLASRLVQLKRKVPALFPLHPVMRWSGPRVIRYNDRMDGYIKQKF